MAVTSLVVVILIAVNALYVAAEFGAVSARRGRIRQLADEGNGMARWMLPVLEDGRKLDRYVAACQIGITLSSLVLGAYGQASLAPQVAPLFEDLGGLQEVAAQSTSAVVVLLGLTSLQVVLGELVPKSVALQFPTQLALYTSIPMRWSLWLFTGFIYVLNGSGILILRLLGQPATGHRHIHSPSEIDLLIAESRDGGLLEPDEQERLHRALRLSLQPVRRLMVPRNQIVAIDIDTPAGELLQEVIGSGFTRLPVFRGSLDEVIGIVHAKDLVAHFARHGKVASLEAIVRPVASIPESARADQLLSLLRQHRTEQALVIDEFGGVAGLVTLRDAIAEVLGAGDVRGDDDEAPEHLPDGRVRLPGSMRIDEAERWLGVHWDSQADTIGGRVIEELGDLPLGGERVTIAGVEVEVERVEDRVVGSLLARPLTASVESPP